MKKQDEQKEKNNSEEEVFGIVDHFLSYCDVYFTVFVLVLAMVAAFIGDGSCQ